MMLPHIKTKWIAALESGDYEQAKRALRSYADADGCDGAMVTGHCCLGVLCDIVAPELWRGTEHDGEGGLPSEAMLARVGINGETARGIALPFVSRADGSNVTLDLANDSGCTFPQIADLIKMFV